MRAVKVPANIGVILIESLSLEKREEQKNFLGKCNQRRELEEVSSSS
jgi:hypothetical protein